MTRTKYRPIPALGAIAVLAWGSAAWAQQGPVGQGFNDAGRVVKRGFQTAGQAVQGGFQRTRTNVHSMEISSRVYSRLHWDKSLTTSTIELEVQAGGVAILTGVVPDRSAKAKALTLTAETVGVIQVVDQLTVGSATRPAPVVPGTPPIIVTPPAAQPAPTIIVAPPGTRIRSTDTPL